ncbi:hypothetical protein FQR65_LT00081 [Abscondita terminalis]|nr:hypothetical protein FQR65_LT00081 [Abscondita terminalis]
MNSFKNTTRFGNYSGTSNSTINNTCTQVSLEHDKKTRKSVFNYKNSVPDKDTDDLDEILDKLLIAYEYMTPAVEEIINTISDFIMPKMQTYEQDDPICSITTEQYDEVIKAIMLIKDASGKKKPKNKIILGRFSIDKFLNAIKRSIKVGSVTTSTFRVYLEKGVVNDLIQLYKLLYDEIQEIYYTSEGESEITPSTHTRMSSVSQKLQQNMIENSEKLASLEAEYQALSDTINILKSVISETTGSGCDIISTAKSNMDVSKKKKPPNSVSSLKTNQCITDASGARRCILECLYELTEVRRHLKISNSKEEVEENSNNVSTMSRVNCCDNQESPHLHAKLNGVPIVLTLNKMIFQCCIFKYNIKVKEEKLVVAKTRHTKKINNMKYKKDRNVYTVNSKDFTVSSSHDENLCHTFRHPNCKDLMLNLGYYINLNGNLSKKAQKVYEVRYFEIEQDIPTKENAPENLRNIRKEKKGFQVKTEICSKLDHLGWNSDSLEVRVFEFKRKNVPKAQEVIQQVKTKIKSKYLNNADYDNEQSSSGKDSISFIEEKKEESSVDVFTYSNKSTKLPKWKLYNSQLIEHINFNLREPSCEKKKSCSKTHNIGVNTSRGLERPPNETSDKFSSIEKYKNLITLHQVVASKDLRKSSNKKHQSKYHKYPTNNSSSNSLESKDLLYNLTLPLRTNPNGTPSSNNTKIDYCEKKVRNHKSIQCDASKVDKKTKTSQTAKTFKPRDSLSSSVNCNYKYTKPIYKLKSNIKFEKIPTSRVRRARIRKTKKERLHALRRKLSNLSKYSDDCCKTALNKTDAQNYFNKETIYSVEMNSNLNRRKELPQKSRFTTEMFDVNKNHYEDTKSHSIEILNDTGVGDYDNARQRDLQNLFINLMQTKESIVFKNLAIKRNHLSNQQRKGSFGNTDNNQSIKDNYSFSEKSGGSIRSSFSNIQFVYGDITPTQNHKIFGIHRSDSNLNIVSIDETSNKCNVKINIEKEVLVTQGNFDFSKYNSLVRQPLHELSMLAKKTDSQLSFFKNSKFKYETKNCIDCAFDAACVKFHCNKSTQLPPVIYRNRSLKKQLPFFIPR